MPPVPKPPPPPKTKSVNMRVSTAVNIAKFVYKLLQLTKQIEFSVVKLDATGEPVSSISHTVDLTDDEHEHLKKGGKLVVVHLCGYQPHVKI